MDKNQETDARIQAKFDALMEQLTAIQAAQKEQAVALAQVNVLKLTLGTLEAQVAAIEASSDFADIARTEAKRVALETCGGGR